MMKHLFCLSILTFLFVGNVSANDADRIFAAGNAAYQNKEYEKAANFYEELLDSDYRSTELEYNLGNAYYRMGGIGKAILHYERSLLLSPGNAEASQNLELLRSKVIDETDALPDFFLVTWWKKASTALTSGTMGTLALVIWWIGFALLALWILGKTRQQKKWGLLGGISLLILSLLPFSLAMSRSSFEKSTHQAIVLKSSAALRSAPDESSNELQIINEGTKVRLDELLSGWWQVTLRNGEKGWLEASSLEQI